MRAYLSLLMGLLGFSMALSQSPSDDWVRVGPKGHGIDPANQTLRSTSRQRMIRVSYGAAPNFDPTIFISTSLGIFKTTDKGNTFSPIANYNSPNWKNDCRLTDFAAHPSNANQLVMAITNTKVKGQLYEMDMMINNTPGKGIQIYKTADEGATWQSITDGLSSNVTYVVKFVYSNEGDKLYACTNYGLWSCNINTPSPIWYQEDLRSGQHDDIFISDVIFSPSSTSNTWNLYAAGDKIYKRSKNSLWSDITASFSGFTGSYVSYLTFTKVNSAEVLIAKRCAGVGYNTTYNTYDCTKGDLKNSFDRTDNGSFYQYDPNLDTWTNLNYSRNTTGYPRAGYTWCPHIEGDTSGNVYDGNLYLYSINIPTIATAESKKEIGVYGNWNCSATHGDIMGMHFNPHANELYVTSHGTFGVYDPDKVSSNRCGKWSVINNAGIPSSLIKTMASSPFTDGELTYSVWDQANGGAMNYQIGDIHYGVKPSNDYENTVPSFYIADHVYITNNKWLVGSSTTSNESDPYSISFEEGNTSCYEFNGNGTQLQSTPIPGTRILQIKRAKEHPQGTFYYVDGQKLHLVQGVLHHSDITTAMAQATVKYDLANYPQYAGHTIRKFTVVDSKTIYLMLYNGCYQNCLYVDATYSNKVIKLTEGQAPQELSIPPHISTIAVKVPHCGSTNDVRETYINKLIVDPHNKQKIYITLGSVQTIDNISTIYYTEDGGSNWIRVFHQYADVDGTPTHDGYSTNPPASRPPINGFYLQGLLFDAYGVLLLSCEDFDLNPNTGDPIFATDYGVYYKKDGFLSTSSWEKYHAKNQPRNSRYLDINTTFNKMYAAGPGGIYCGDIPCHNNSGDININFFEHNKIYQTSDKIVSYVGVTPTHTEILRAGKSITFLPGFNAAPTTGSVKAFIGACSYTTMPYKNIRVEPSFTRVSAFREESTKDQEGEEEEMGISVYPNPTPDKVRLSLKNAEEKVYAVVLLNSLGQQLLKVEPVQDNLEIDLTPYQGNAFILELRMPSQKKSIKIMKIQLKDGE